MQPETGCAGAVSSTQYNSWLFFVVFVGVVVIQRSLSVWKKDWTTRQQPSRMLVDRNGLIFSLGSQRARPGSSEPDEVVSAEDSIRPGLIF